MAASLRAPMRSAIDATCARGTSLSPPPLRELQLSSLLLQQILTLLRWRKPISVSLGAGGIATPVVRDSPGRGAAESGRAAFGNPSAGGFAPPALPSVLLRRYLSSALHLVPCLACWLPTRLSSPSARLARAIDAARSGSCGATMRCHTRQADLGENDGTSAHEPFASESRAYIHTMGEHSVDAVPVSYTHLTLPTKA